MKKFARYLVVLFFLFIDINVLAWKGDYNYEVTSFTVDGDQAIVSGWAIMNALQNANTDGLGQNWVRRGNRFDRQSGVIKYDVYGYDGRYGLLIGRDWIETSTNVKIIGAHCSYGTRKYKHDGANIGGGNYNADYLYRYTLEIYSVKDGRTVEKIEGATEELTPEVVSLTYAQAYKINDVAYAIVLPNDTDGSYPYTTACYEDVGFKFKIDLTKLPKKDNIDGYKMRLTVRTGARSTCTTNCSETFDLTALNIDGSSVSESINDGYLTNVNNTVTNLMKNGYPWNEPGFGNSKNGDYAIQIGQELEVVDVTLKNNIRWYQVKVKHVSQNQYSNLWIPSSWVIPSGSATLITNDTPVETPSACTATPIELETTKDEATTCNGVTTISNTEGRRCLENVSSTEYYKILCEEETKTKFIPGVLNKIKPGRPFTFNIEVTTTNKCLGTFDTDAWKNAYNLNLEERNKYEEGSSDYNLYNNKIRDLVGVVESYNGYTSDNRFNIPTATLNLVYKVNGLGASKLYKFTTGETDHSNSTENLLEHRLNIAGVNNPNNFQYTTTNKVILIPATSYINNVTGEVQNTNCEYCVNVGNKFYLDKNIDARDIFDDDTSIGKYKFTITVSNLGKNNETIIHEKCGIDVVENVIYYRAIDIKNPFIQNVNLNDRVIGRNWNNETYDFTKIIEEDIWEEEPLYIINLNKNDINNGGITLDELKESNKNYTGSSEYLGQCQYGINEDDPVCQLLDSIRE